MDLHDFVKLLRTRWITIFVTALVGVLAAITVTLIQTPQYESSTRLFVSASSGASATEVFQGMRYSQERVISYTELIMGETLAQRTIDRLDRSRAAGRAGRCDYRFALSGRSGLCRVSRAAVGQVLPRRQ